MKLKNIAQVMILWLFCQPVFAMVSLTSSLPNPTGRIDNLMQSTGHVSCHHTSEVTTNFEKAQMQMSMQENMTKEPMDHEQCKKDCDCCGAQGNAFLFSLDSQSNTLASSVSFKPYTQHPQKALITSPFRPPIPA
jgi:hypothetical protein